MNAKSRVSGADVALPGVIDVAARAFIESGCALLIGTVDGAGMPHAGRGWGLDVEDPVAGRVRIVLAGDDPVTVANLRSTGPRRHRYGYRDAAVRAGKGTRALPGCGYPG